MSFILALDQGTTSSRAILFDKEGNIKGTAQKEFTQFYPKAGWVEHDANEIWETQYSVAKQVLSDHSLRASDIVAIGITNQRETAIVWDRMTGQPMAPAIVWQDRRTADICDQLASAGHSRTIEQKSGLIIDAYFSGTKVRWILDNVPGARAKAQAGELAFGTVDSWLIWKLTNGSLHVTDPTNACRTMLYNLYTNDWDEELLSILNIPRSMLPKIVPSSGVIAETAPGLFDKPIKIAGIAGDQQAALFGQNCLKTGMVKNTYGTGCFMLMNVGKQVQHSRHRLISSVAWQIGSDGSKDFVLEGSVFIAGAAVQWLRDGLGIIQSSSEMEALATSVPDNGGVYFVPALAGLGAPHWDAYARGSIQGLTRGTNKGHLARAALEGIAFQVADVLDAMRQDSGVDIHELRCDGGASVNNFLMQFQADILQVPVVRPKIVETTALGAAFMAGLAVGYWSNLEQLESIWKADRIFEPNMTMKTVLSAREQWSEAVKRSGQWIKA